MRFALEPRLDERVIEPEVRPAERAIESASLVREESEALRQAARQLRKSRDDA